MPALHGAGSSAVTETATAADPEGAATVGTSSSTIIAANDDRVEATICNDHATNVVYLALGETAVANSGIRLNAGGGAYTTPQGYTGAVSAIATGASTNVTFTEL